MSLRKQRTDSSPWTIAILDCLRNKGWVDYQTVVDIAGVSIPEGKALTVSEYYRSRVNSAPRVRGNAADSGRRVILSKAVASLQGSGRIEVEYDERRRPVRARETIWL